MVDMNRNPTSKARKVYLVQIGLDPDQSNIWASKWRSLYDRKRNVCTLTFEQYVGLALEANITDPNQIGRSIDKFQMARTGDSGDYSLGNCRFITMRDNIKEKVINGGTKAQANKLRGRTKFNHPGVARISLSKVGKTAENCEYIRSATEKQRGVPKPAVSEALTGRRKDTHSYIQTNAQSNSNGYRLVSPLGEVHCGINLTEFCLDNGLEPTSMFSVCLGKAPSHRGWVGEYTSINNNNSIRCAS